MKTSSTIRIASKNIFHNFSRSILTLISITLLSIVIITLTNMCYYYDKNTKEMVLDYIKENGTEVEIKGLEENDILNHEDVEMFIKKTKALDVFYEYHFYVEHMSAYINSQEENYIGIAPYYGGKERQGGNPEFVESRAWTEEDISKNHIWLSNNKEQTKNININDTIRISINGRMHDFVVKGKVDDYYSYIDYKYFNIERLAVFDTVNKYEDLSIVKQIMKLKKMETDNFEIYGFTIALHYEQQYYTWFVAGICIFLTLLCIFLSMGCILNALSISIMKNSQSIGIMKALGMKNKNIYQFILFQVGILIVIATVISTLISWIIAKFTLATQIELVMSVLGEYKRESWILGFNFLIPLFNIIILAVSVVLGSIRMLKKFFKKEAIVIIKEVE